VFSQRPADYCEILKPGSYYATDLGREIDLDGNQKLHQLDPNDNLDDRALINMVAKKFVTVGYIRQPQLKEIY
jgi:hypothetical protein